MGEIDDLEQLAGLRDRGILTEEEFSRKKAAILQGRAPAPPGAAAKPSRARVVLMTILGLVALLVLAGIYGKSNNPPASDSASTGGSAAAASTNLAASSSPAVSAKPDAVTKPSAMERMQALMPQEQRGLLAAVAAARQVYAAGANDMAKGAARPGRASAICATLSSGDAVTGWVGMVSALSTNGDGKGVLAVQIGPDTNVQTWNNAISDVSDNTLIDPASALFAAASALHKHQLVRFSGRFIQSKTDCIEESSLTMNGSISSPEFIFVFSAVQPVP